MRTKKDIRNEIEKYELFLQQTEESYMKRKITRNSYMAKVDCYNHKLEALRWAIGDREKSDS